MISMAPLYRFYRSELKNVHDTILNGGVSIFVGINTIGKTYLAQQILSDDFRSQYLKKEKVYLVHLDFKDKKVLKNQDVYKFWLDKTHEAVRSKVKEISDFNEFTFYSELTEVINGLKTDERISFIVSDAQNIIDKPESLFSNLTYLLLYSYGKISFIILSEPHILDSQNSHIQAFIQRFTKNKFMFLKTFDRKTAKADLCIQEQLLQTDFRKFHAIIIRNAKGLHGAIRTFCFLLKNNPGVKNIRSLMKVAYDDKLCQNWVKEVLDSLPRESINILKQVSLFNVPFSKFKLNNYGKWLIDLGILNKNGTPHYSLLQLFLKKYSIPELNNLPSIELKNNSLYLKGERVQIPENEMKIMKLLYRSKGQVISYDKIGNVLWKNKPEKYSLWAIAQVIRRIREILIKYSINPKTINSVRGEGYIYN